MNSKAVVAEANARATDLCLEFHRDVPHNTPLRHELYAFVKDAKSAYKMVQALEMFGFMELGASGNHESVAALCIAAKVVAYQHFMLNKKKYGLGKKKTLAQAGSPSRGRRIGN